MRFCRCELPPAPGQDGTIVRDYATPITEFVTFIILSEAK
jgi:hypothetical protein